MTIDVPVGADMVVPLKPRDRELEGAKLFAEKLVPAMINIYRGEKLLVRYAEAIRRAARKEIAAARDAGLDILLDRVDFKPTFVYHVAGTNWREAVYAIIAVLRVRNTSFHHLRPEISEVIVEEPEDVGHELSQLLEDQRERQDRLAELRRMGADLVVDAITLALLKVHNLSATDVLREVWEKECASRVICDHDGAERTLHLGSFEGQVMSSAQIANVAWMGDFLSFQNQVDPELLDAAAGGQLGELVRHPTFSALTVSNIEKKAVGSALVHFVPPGPRHLFEASTGRLWPEDAEAA